MAEVGEATTVVHERSAGARPAETASRADWDAAGTDVIGMEAPVKASAAGIAGRTRQEVVLAIIRRLQSESSE